MPPEAHVSNSGVRTFTELLDPAITPASLGATPIAPDVFDTPEGNDGNQALADRLAQQIGESRLRRAAANMPPSSPYA